MAFTFGKRRPDYAPGLGFALGTAAGIGVAVIANRRRRALIRDKLVSFTRMGSHAVAKKSLDLTHRLNGTIAELRGRFEGPVDDDVLVERVRAALGHVISHTGGLSVQAKGGRVTLSGHLFEGDRERLATALAKVRGVRELETHFDLHADASRRIPSLQ